MCIQLFLSVNIDLPFLPSTSHYINIASNLNFELQPHPHPTDNNQEITIYSYKILHQTAIWRMITTKAIELGYCSYDVSCDLKKNKPLKLQYQKLNLTLVGTKNTLEMELVHSKGGFYCMMQMG